MPFLPRTRAVTRRELPIRLRRAMTAAGGPRQENVHARRQSPSVLPRATTRNISTLKSRQSAPHFEPSNTGISHRANKDNISYGLTRSSLQGGEPILSSDAWCPAECPQG